VPEKKFRYLWNLHGDYAWFITHCCYLIVASYVEIYNI